MAREGTLVALLAARLPAIGDDCAVVRSDVSGGGVLLLCADAAVAGVHADLALVGLDDLGWKALVACVSDVAAMGGEPRWALVTVSGMVDEGGLALLYDGLLAAAEEWSCPVVGGDLTGGEGLVVSVSVVGTCEGEPVLRSGARAGDELWVTGPLGASAAGLAELRAGRAGGALARAHARPRARVAEGRVARLLGATAMIDVSDGLATDVRHLADESGVGVVVEAVPLAESVVDVSLGLGGGEDYELLFSLPAGGGAAAAAREAFAVAGLRPPVRVGRCTADPSERRLGDAPLPDVGWEHRS